MVLVLAVLSGIVFGLGAIFGLDPSFWFPQFWYWEGFWSRWFWIFGWFGSRWQFCLGGCRLGGGLGVRSSRPGVGSGLGGGCPLLTPQMLILTF